MDGCHRPESGSRRQSGGKCGKGLPLGAGYGEPSSMLLMGHSSACRLRGALLGAGYEAPSSVLVMRCPPQCWLRDTLLGAGYGALSWMLVMGHPPGCRLRGALLGAGYGLTAVNKTQNPCLGLPLKTSQTLTSPVRAAKL